MCVTVCLLHVFSFSPSDKQEGVVVGRVWYEGFGVDDVQGGQLPVVDRGWSASSCGPGLQGDLPYSLFVRQKYKGALIQNDLQFILR